MVKRIRAARHYQHPRAPVRQIADAAIPGIKRAFYQTLKSGRRLFDKAKAAELIRSGRIDEVPALIGWKHQDEAMRRPLGLLGKLWHESGSVGARKINGSFTSRRMVVRHKRMIEPLAKGESLDDYLLRAAVAKDSSDLFDFDIFDPVTEGIIRTYQDALITALNADQRSTVAAIILDSVRRGDSPDEIADLLYSVIGLTPAQAQAVQNLRQALYQAERWNNFDSNLLSAGAAAAARAAAKSGEPLDQEHSDQIVQDYADNQLAYRADMIATTEATRAASLGLQSAYTQAADRGVFPIEAVTQRWQISLDEKTCPLCLSVVDRNPDGIGLDEQFDSEDGPIDAPPGHPNCRCSIEIVLNLDMVPDENVDPGLDFAMRDLSKYDDAEARDDHGRWTSGGGGSTNASDLYQPTTKTADEIIAGYPGGAEAIRQVEARLAQVVSTDKPVSEGGFVRPDGTYTEERQALHQAILDKIFSDEAVAAAIPAEGDPTMTMLGGRGGSGKSWLTGPDGPVDPSKAILLDGDAVKAMLPEYQGWNAAQVHEESSHIVSLADIRAQELGVNVIHDATMKTEASAVQRVLSYEANGYNINGYYMYASPETAAERAMGRFSKGGTFTGRYVPVGVILGNTKNEANFDKLKTGFQQWGIYDNNTAGAPAPRLVAKGGKR